MTDKHVELGYKISEITGLSSNRIHWQPDSSTTLKFPCVLYEFSKAETFRANDKNYVVNRRYSITHIFKENSSEKIDDFLSNFQMISHDSRQIVDGLYHDYYTLFY